MKTERHHSSIAQQTTAKRNHSGFTLVAVLMIIALLTVSAVGLLSIVERETKTTGFYNNQVRTRMIADAGIADAIKLLESHTKYGNYVTAMAPVADSHNVTNGPQLYHEIYRSTWFPGEDPTQKHLVQDDGNNPITGDYLFSLSTGTFQGQELIESRPLPNSDIQDINVNNQNNSKPWQTLTYFSNPTNPNNQISTFLGADVTSDGTIQFNDLVTGTTQNATIPTLTDSYNFNDTYEVNGQTVNRVHTENVQALGQWVKMRDEDGNIIGRFAYFIEDESMKVNVNHSGVANRINDMLATSMPTGVTFANEISPAGLLSNITNLTQSNQVNAQIIATGNFGQRFKTPTDIVRSGNHWNTNLNEILPNITTLSESNNTTAKGWEKMNLNEVVADNPATDAALMIADWIEEAWTGSKDFNAMDKLDLKYPYDEGFQLYNHEFYRLQLAANIVDYIDSDSIPTDLGDYDGTVPVIGVFYL